MKPDEVVRAFLADSAWGALEQIHALPGKPYACFCLLERGGLYLEVTKERVQRCTPLAESFPVRWELGAWRGHIQLPHRRFDLRAARAKTILEALGLARLRARITARLPRACSDGPFWQAPGPELELLLAERSAAGELSLACVRTKASLDGDSSYCGGFTAPAWLWVTDRRVELVACSPTGDLAAEPLAASELHLDAKGTVTTPHRRWSQPSEPLQQLLPALSLEGSARALEVVRLGHRSTKPLRGRPPASLTRWALSLLDCLKNDASTHAAAALLASAIRHGEPPAPPAAAQDLPASGWQLDLLSLHSSWALPPGAGWHWLARLPKPSAELMPRALRLARHCWQLARESETDPIGRASADADFAEALLRLGQPQEAAEHAERTRRDLPSLELGDIELGPGSSSPWAGQRRRLGRVRLQAATTPQQRVRALLDVWSLDPLNLELLEQVSVACAPRLARRARLALTTLTQAPPKPQPRSRRVDRGLPESLLSVNLQHPFARQQTPLNARLQQLVASEEHPDLDSLRLYCQRITRSDSLITRTVDELATLFGLGHIECYVSRGYEDVGVRAYSDQPPFLLLGGQHLDAQSRHHLPPAELAFAVGAELLHVRFKQRRVSTRDVYRGALDKGRRSIDLALSLIPVISTIHLGKRLTMVTAKLSLPQLRRAIHAAKGVSEVVERSATPGKARRLDLSPATEELIAFQWLQQLNADRAGLLCAQDLTAAVRALLRSRVELARAASTFERQGVLAALERHRESNPNAFDDLRARVGLMLTFYLSDEFETLTDAAFVPAADTPDPPADPLGSRGEDVEPH